ncbi:MAG: diacylglycerol kinase family lipid kinase [Vagococcus sp.]|uniref:diacylglycerol/lipid kinase family protein n=1 Tax=Vagococcus sp. TaxID=1933889 RepID=UPI002FCC3D11
MKKITIIYNPISGNGENKKIAHYVKKELSEHWKTAHIEVYESKGSIDLYSYSKNCSEKKYDLIVALGGDGTINKVVLGIVDGGNFSSLGIIPTGTVNNFVQALEIPIDIKKSVKVLLKNNVKNIDIAKVNDKVMISSLTIGLFADVALYVTSDDKKKFGFVTYLLSFIKIKKFLRKHQLEICFNDQKIVSNVAIVIISMTNSLGGFSTFSPHAQVNDGLMHVYIINNLSFYKIMKYLQQIVSGKKFEVSKLESFHTDSLTIKNKKMHSSKKSNTRIDGDPSEDLPIKIEVLPHYLKVMVNT